VSGGLKRDRKLRSDGENLKGLRTKNLKEIKEPGHLSGLFKVL
jgi:hypothetical protein